MNGTALILLPVIVGRVAHFYVTDKSQKASLVYLCNAVG